MCAEFPCLSPAAAIEALENDAGGLIFKIIEFRAYQAAYESYKEGQKLTDASQRPTGPTIDLVRENTFLLAEEEIKRRREQG